MKSRIIRGNWDYLHFWFSVWLDRGDAPTSDKHIFHCWITKPRGKLGEFGKSSIYHWCGVCQHSHICSVRIKNYWEVYVQSWHTVFNLPLWPEGEYNWSHLFIFLGLLLIIWTKWLSRELPEVLLNFAHFSLATFPPESVFNIIHIRCRKKDIWACFTWEAPLHRTHVLGLRLRQNTSTCDNSISALTPRQDLPSPWVDKWCASETRHSPGCALAVKFLAVKRKGVMWKNHPKINEDPCSKYMASHRAYKLTIITAPPDKKQAFLEHCRICQICQGSWHRILCYLTFTEWQIQECGNQITCVVCWTWESRGMWRSLQSWWPPSTPSDPSCFF